MQASRILLIFSFMILLVSQSFAQRNRQDNDLVQFSGLVLDGTTENLVPVPYATVSVKDQSRGTYSDLKGFFTIVVRRGDIVTFSAIGYKSVDFEIPMDLEDERYSMVQLMTQDTFNLPEAVVFPWPSRDHFRLEFLAMDVTPELQRIAQENLAQETLERLRPAVRYDGNENADYYLRQQAREYYYIGQQPPMNIFNATAWKRFFDSWKNGDFKKKKEN